MTYLEVAVAAPIEHTLTYLPPAHEGPALAPGLRLLVPLKGRLVTGYLLSINDAAPEFKVKRATEVLDDFPLFPAGLIPFFRWVAQYYQFPLGEVIRGALPAGLAPRSGRRIILREEGLAHLTALQEQIVEGSLPWLKRLVTQKNLPAAAVRKLWQGPDRKRLEDWAAKDWVEIVDGIFGQTAKVKTEPLVRLTGAESPLPLKPSEKRTLEIIARLSQGIPGGAVPVKEVQEVYAGAGRAIQGLCQQGLAMLELREVYRDPFGERLPSFPRPKQLSEEQENALAALAPALRKAVFAPFLLHGVTGSGKTEVYLQAADITLQQGRGVLILVPEIALATQLEGHFLSRFGNRVALLHSGLTDGERFDQWLRLVRKEASIAIGARSAVFAPLADPGLIIVDEEHDGAYKQEDGLRYQGRDLAILRAKFQNATVLLGSATPALQTYFHAQNGKYRLLSLTRRVEDRPMPAVELVDLKEIKTVSGRPPLFSPSMVTAIRENLDHGDQSLVFLNRRGFANLMICQDCGHAMQCRNCKITLTLHKGRGELTCHYCGYTMTSAALCPACQGTRLQSVGMGTERIEAELAALFPKARLARMDRDTTDCRGDFLKILRAVHQREIDILVGTQMITKGHHFPHVTLVCIIWADAGLNFPDYKAGERTFQLLCQVMGRAGRGDKSGRVIVQTHQPGHHSVRTAMGHDYAAFYAQEMALRMPLAYPPLSRLINLRLEGDDETQVQTVAESLGERAKKMTRKWRSVSVLGPAPAPLARLRGKFRWQLLLKGPNMDALHGLCRAAVQEKIPAVASGAVKLLVDVDPENML